MDCLSSKNINCKCVNRVKSFSDVDLKYVQLPVIGVYVRQDSSKQEAVAVLFDIDKPIGIEVVRNSVGEIIKGIESYFPSSTRFGRCELDVKELVCSYML